MDQCEKGIARRSLSALPPTPLIYREWGTYRSSRIFGSCRRGNRSQYGRRRRRKRANNATHITLLERERERLMYSYAGCIQLVLLLLLPGPLIVGNIDSFVYMVLLRIWDVPFSIYILSRTFFFFFLCDSFHTAIIIRVTNLLLYSSLYYITYCRKSFRLTAASMRYNNGRFFFFASTISCI